MENSAPSLLRARHLQAAKLTYHQVTCFDLGCERGNTPPGCTRLTLLSANASGQPALSVAHSVCEGKVIRVIVTSTMTKLGQCNPNPLHCRQG
ncbi:hypothetical protein ATANTOWER_006524 [Ataeniobius toweri]|uniref:Uncharacterized protein n=1 Tax=Ataeniobius toweri TaxID=208326 RepID=A0ABU7BF09_9TELE|nr:hypothetical protein [Ataeniobius toweri]